MDIKTPAKMGPYTLRRLVGIGAAGSVYEARSNETNERFAIKFLHPELAKDPLQRKRFAREARTTLSLKHPNIVGGHRAGACRKIPFIVMDYVDGKTLQAVFDEQGPLDPLTGVDCLLQAAVGLAAAAEAGQVHRDIKPTNLMLTNEGTLKITDFGLSRSSDCTLALTCPNHVVGTPNFIAPEQALCEEIDFRADMYALGATFYYLFTGSLPFPGARTATEALHAHAFGTPKPISELRPVLPARLCRLVDRLMARKPAARYRSYEALIANLEYLKRSLASDERHSKPTIKPATSGRIRPLGRNRRTASATSAKRRTASATSAKRRIACVHPIEQSTFAELSAHLPIAAAAVLIVFVSLLCAI